RACSLSSSLLCNRRPLSLPSSPTRRSSDLRWVCTLMPYGTCCLKNSLMIIARERAFVKRFRFRFAGSDAVLVGGDADAGAHGGGHGGALEVLALSGGGLRLGDGLQDSVQVG